MINNDNLMANLQARAEAKKQKNIENPPDKKRKWIPFKKLLTKQERDVIDRIDCEVITILMNAGQYVKVALILGVIADQKRNEAPMSAEHEMVLQMMAGWWRATVADQYKNDI
jgi:hypothetical protein